MDFRHVTAVITLILLSAVLPLAALAAEEIEAPVTKPGPQATTLLNLDAEAVAKLRPMDREIRELLLGEQATVAELTARLAAEPDRLRILRIHQRIAFEKDKAEIAVMKVQARYAEADGRLEQAREIRAALEPMLADAALRAAKLSGAE